MATATPESIEPQLSDATRSHLRLFDEVIVIEPKPKESPFGLREVWEHRELLYYLGLRDIKIRYRQTTLGVLWAVLQPLGTMLIFTTVFGRWVTESPADVPYSLTLFSGMLLWFFFSGVVNGGMMSVLGSQSLFTKVHFPRLIAPISTMGPCLLDLGISMLLLVPLMIYHRTLPSWTIVMLPLVLLFSTMLSLGVGAALAAITVKYRDFRYVVPFALQIWLYSSTLIWPQGLLPQSMLWFNRINPLAVLGASFRYSLFGMDPGFDFWGFALTGVVSAATLWLGIRIFRSLERSFADVI